MEKLRQLWNGDIHFGRMYWVYGVLIGGVGSTVGDKILLSHREEMIAYGSWEPVSMVFLAMCLAYFFLIYVGIWRASNQYGGPRLWAILAKIGIVVSVNANAWTIYRALMQ